MFLAQCPQNAAVLDSDRRSISCKWVSLYFTPVGRPRGAPLLPVLNTQQEVKRISHTGGDLIKMVHTAVHCNQSASRLLLNKLKLEADWLL